MMGAETRGRLPAMMWRPPPVDASALLLTDTHFPTRHDPDAFHSPTGCSLLDPAGLRRGSRLHPKWSFARGGEGLAQAHVWPAAARTPAAAGRVAVVRAAPFSDAARETGTVLAGENGLPWERVVCSPRWSSVRSLARRVHLRCPVPVHGCAARMRFRPVCDAARIRSVS